MTRFHYDGPPRLHPYAAPGESIANAIARHERTAAEFEADVPTDLATLAWTRRHIDGHRMRAAALRAET